MVLVPTLKLTSSTTRPCPNDLDTSRTRSASRSSPFASASFWTPGVRERERRRVLSGRTGAGAARLCIEDEGVLYIDTGRARRRPVPEGVGDGCDSRSLSWPLNLGILNPELRHAALPIVSSFGPESESSAVSYDAAIDIGDDESGAFMPLKSRGALRERGMGFGSDSRLELDMIESPRATV